MGHPPRIPVWLRWEQSVIYFVTIYVADCEAVLANKRTLGALKTAAARLHDWNLLAAVLMPDHRRAERRSRRPRRHFSAALKRWIRKDLDATWKWQAGCFDRLLRSNESLHKKWLYVEENPVRAGLVKDSRDWPFRIGFDEAE
jgi:hypothetical protein